MNAMLNITLIHTTPKKNIRSDNLLLELSRVILPPRYKKYPTTKLKHPQSTFTKGEESPCPGGFANGVGNGLPDMPFTK